MQSYIVFGVLAGLLLVSALTAWAGVSLTLDAVKDVGWFGLAWVCTLQVVSLALCAAALRLVTPGSHFLSCIAARWIRDGASNLVAVIPGLGEAAGTRAFVLMGTSASLAIAGSILDVAVEAGSQALYTLIGLVLLFFITEQSEGMRWITAAAAASVPIASVYLVARHQGALVTVERLMKRLDDLFGISVADTFIDIAAAVRNLYRRRTQIALALLVHLAAWVIGAVQVWAAAQAMDRPIELGASFALESVAYAVRSALFIVPWGAGIQEGSFVVIGALVGIDAAGAVALSLILRARDLLLGLPAVLLWSAVEGHRFLVERRSADFVP